jgi:hypothetical protein
MFRHKLTDICNIPQTSPNCQHKTEQQNRYSKMAVRKGRKHLSRWQAKLSWLGESPQTESPYHRVQYPQFPTINEEDLYAGIRIELGHSSVSEKEHLKWRPWQSVSVCLSHYDPVTETGPSVGLSKIWYENSIHELSSKSGLWHRHSTYGISTFLPKISIFLDRFWRNSVHKLPCIFVQ